MVAMQSAIRVLQVLPSMYVGGVERGVLTLDEAFACTTSSIQMLVASAGGPLAAGLRCHVRLLTLRWRGVLACLFLNPLLLALCVCTRRVHIIHARSRLLALSALLVRRALLARVKLVVTWHG